MAAKYFFKLYKKNSSCFYTKRMYADASRHGLCEEKPHKVFYMTHFLLPIEHKRTKNGFT